jgi:mRNA-degrading endonuclease YafQ of YafQ-DinJ toxin-antitoxin module
MKIYRSANFDRNYKKYVRKLTVRQFAEVHTRMKLFEQDWQSPELKTHKLKNAGEKWAFTVLHDSSRNDRAVFIFAVKNQEIWLLGVGSHDVVYGKN